MTRPKYRDLRSDLLPETETDEGAKIRVIAGDAMGGRLTGPVEGLTVSPKFVDVSLPEGGSFRDEVPAGHTAFAYVDHGEVLFGPQKRAVSEVLPRALLAELGLAKILLGSSGGGRFLLAAARPLNEPIARYGPFVMNTRSEIEQTLRELQTGRFIRKEPVDG